jgi:formate dehydrogenase iron-sulfur subunit
MCYYNINEGKLNEPACTRACPVGATIFGTRDELLAEAKKRIRENPGKYLDHVWGEKEVGGTHVLYISHINLDFLGWKPDLGTDPLPATTWPALKIVPGVFLGVGVAMSAACWIINRRIKVMGEESGEHEISSAEDPPPDEDKKGGAESK